VAIGKGLNNQSFRPRHLLSVDVEEYFMVEAFSDCVSRDSWESRPSRVVMSTRCALDLFDRYGVKATFFFVGWVAEKFPSLVREVHARGHELACHSYWHRPVYSLTREEFREDTRRAKSVIEQTAGVRVIGYRAPSWSITKSCLWALEVRERNDLATRTGVEVANRSKKCRLLQFVCWV